MVENIEVSIALRLQKQQFDKAISVLESLSEEERGRKVRVERELAAKQCWNVLAVMDNTARTAEEISTVSGCADELKRVFQNLRISEEILFYPAFDKLRCYRK